MTDHRDPQAKLLSLAVHEFRTPVAVVSGYLRMLLRHFGENLTEQQRKLLQESEKSCGNLANLLTELSDLAHFDDVTPGLRERVPLFSMLREIAGGMNEGADRGVRLEVHDRGADGGPLVKADAARLRSAIGSLLFAALRERVDGIVLAACRVVQEGDGVRALIAIADADVAEQLLDGAGSADQAGSFDQYRGGMGFRLPLAARIIQAHGGRVSSPVAARGRLAIVLSLPVATKSENAA